MPNEQETQDRLTRVETRVGLRSNASNLRPYEHEPSIPIVSGFQVLLTNSTSGVTTVIIGWETPDNPDFETLELWVRDLSNQATGEVKISECREGPATLVLTSDASTAKTIFGRTRMRNGQGSALTASPTVTAQITVATTAPGPNSVTNTMLQRTGGDPIRVVSADIVSITADKITTGTITSAFYGLNVGNNLMAIDGTNGFRQYNATLGRTTQIFDGNMLLFDSGASIVIGNGAGGPQCLMNSGAGFIEMEVDPGTGPAVKVNGLAGAGTFTTTDGKTVTVVGGIVTSIV